MGKGKKYQIQSQKITHGKTITPQESYERPLHEQRFSFQLECCDSSCCYSKIKETKDRADFADRLHELSQSNWGVIISTGRKGLGFEKLGRVDIFDEMLPVGSKLIGFIYHDNHRMMGYRDRMGMFHILGFDYDGKRYKH